MLIVTVCSAHEASSESERSSCRQQASPGHTEVPTPPRDPADASLNATSCLGQRASPREGVRRGPEAVGSAEAGFGADCEKMQVRRAGWRRDHPICDHAPSDREALIVLFPHLPGSPLERALRVAMAVRIPGLTTRYEWMSPGRAKALRAIAMAVCDRALMGSLADR